MMESPPPCKRSDEIAESPWPCKPSDEMADRIDCMKIVGCHATDVFMIHRFEQSHPDTMFMFLDTRCQSSSVSPLLKELLPDLEYKHVCFRDYLIWNYDPQTGRLENETGFRSQLERYVRFAPRFIAAFVRGDEKHRNILILDKLHRTFHYLEPNDVPDSAAADWFLPQSVRKQYYDTREYFRAMVRPWFPVYTMQWTGYQIQRLKLKREYDLNPDQTKTVERGFCAGFCYFYLIQVVSDTLGIKWSMTACLTSVVDLMSADMKRIREINALFEEIRADVPIGDKLNGHNTHIGTLIESRLINRVFALEYPKEYRAAWSRHIATCLSVGGDIVLDFVFGM